MYSIRNIMEIIQKGRQNNNNRKEKKVMAKVQFQKGSLMVAIPPLIAKYMEIGKGDKIDYEFNKETGRVELVKVKEGENK